MKSEPRRLSFVTRVGWNQTEALALGIAKVTPERSRVGQLVLPSMFECIVREANPESADAPLFLASLMYAVEDGMIVLRAIYASTHELDETLAILKAARSLAEWKDMAFMLLAADEAEDGGSDARAAMLAAHATPTRRRRNRVTNELLREVAEVYRTAWSEGAPPTLTVAEHFKVAHSTAARYVGLAREAGHLGRADGSRGGEVDPNA